MAPVSLYVDGLHTKFGHHATWLPDEKLKLGDVGVFKDGRFFVRTSLERLGIRVSVRQGNRGDALSHTSGDSISIELGASVPDNGVKITFGCNGSFLFQTSDTRTDTIENMADVSQEILFAFRKEKYERDWAVIDRLVSASSATILIASSDAAEVTLGAKGPIGSLRALADAALDVHVRHSTGELTQYVASSDLTPMFGASRLRRTLLRGIVVDPMRTDGEPAANEAPLEDIADEDRFAAQEDT